MTAIKFVQNFLILSLYKVLWGHNGSARIRNFWLMSNDSLWGEVIFLLAVFLLLIFLVFWRIITNFSHYLFPHSGQGLGAGRTYVLKQFINQIMAAKRQIVTRSQLGKMDSEQLMQSSFLLQDEILGNQTELLQQNNTINERLGDLSKKFQDLLNENNIIKSRLAVAQNTSSLLKSNSKKFKEQLTNIECRPVQTWTICETGVYWDSRHSSNHNNKEFRRYYHKDILKNWNINQQAHDRFLPQTR